MLYDGFGTSASNLGAGADGKVAAQTQSSMQKAARYLSRRGQITCGADHAVRCATWYCHVLYTPLRKLRAGEIIKEQGPGRLAGWTVGWAAAALAMATAISAAATKGELDFAAAARAVTSGCGRGLRRRLRFGYDGGCTGEVGGDGGDGDEGLGGDGAVAAAAAKGSTAAAKGLAVVRRRRRR